MGCALCRLGRGDEALTVLREATEDGLLRPEEWLRDDDFAVLRAGDGLEERLNEALACCFRAPKVARSASRRETTPPGRVRQL